MVLAPTMHDHDIPKPTEASDRLVHGKPVLWVDLP
jgi:hypothetical protein